jgi:hypothetical protein
MIGGSIEGRCGAHRHRRTAVKTGTAAGHGRYYTNRLGESNSLRETYQ